MTALLSAHGLGKVYAGTGWRPGTPRPVLADVEFAIEDGECVALIGRSGSGKSTLARLLLGLERPSAGVVRFRGLGLAGLDDAGTASFQVGGSDGSPGPALAVNPRHKIGRTIAEPLRHLTGLSAAARASPVHALLSLVGSTNP